MHRVTRCFLHNCWSSLQDKIISFVQVPLLKWHKRLYGRSQLQEWEKERDETIKCVSALFLGEEGKDIWPVPEWFCSPPCLQWSCLYLQTVSWLTAQPHSVCWLGTVHTLRHSLWRCSHTVLPPSFTITCGTQDVGFKRKYEVKMKALHWVTVWIFLELFVFLGFRAHNNDNLRSPEQIAKSEL